MGVPKFYRWLSERYPCLSEVINDTQIPEFDNLYLDMNGIIHNCSHPNDDDVTFRITEEQIFLDIFTYIEKLFRIIRPKKVFYMAIDGVAPRAKMNQQRARRFMSARTAEEQLTAAKKKGEEIPEEKRFDSNCITPGTYFMTKLHAELCSWVERKINSDPAWQGVRVYLSGHDCPGEGEHKIMDFIRAERVSKDYDPNTRHCMYGLDADLIMLGICSHEPHFSLLREEVKFSRPVKQGKGKKKEAPKRIVPSETTFHLLHLSLLREYLAWEFDSIKLRLPFEYDMERIVDDWVLMGFLIGNDFIPHLPHVHIHDDALPLLYSTYKTVLPKLDGYLNEGGHLNLKRFEIFLKEVAQNDKEHYMQIMEDGEFMRAKVGSVPAGQMEGPHEEEMNQFNELERYVDSDLSTDDEEDERDVTEAQDGKDAAFVSSDEECDTQSSTDIECTSSSGLQSAADLLNGMNFDPVEDEFAEQLALAEFKQTSDKEFENNVQNIWSKSIGNSFKRHKRDYYREKLRFSNISKDQLRKQSEGYVRAIQWVLHYYYHGCVSWDWYFPHHYAPYISDVVDFSTMSMDFQLSTPFKPFEQLLAVLPAASADCLPLPLRELMCSTESPIADFYPTEFQTDLNGKKNDWEAVVLIPFIDEKRLLAAIESKNHLLSAEEKSRNSHGGHMLFTTDSTKPPGKYAVRTVVPKDEFRIPQSDVVWGLLQNVKLDVYFPGFPTMKHRPHTAYLKEVNVKVFQMPSRKPSMVLKVADTDEIRKDLLEVAFDIIGKEVCIDWPVLKMGLVDCILSEDKKYARVKDEEVTVVDLTATEKCNTHQLIADLKDKLISRYAIDVADASAVVFVRRFLGVSYEVTDGILKPVKQWGGSDTAVPVLLPLVVMNVLVEEGKRLGEIPVELAYPPKSKVFVMENSWAGFGCPALVDSILNPGQPTCRVVVVAAVPVEPDMISLVNNYSKLSMPWCSAYDAGKRCGVHGRLVGRLTGTMFMFNGEREETERGGGFQEKLNIGLALKLSKRNQEVPNYTRRTPDGFWSYSILCIRLLTEYRNKFRDLVSFLEQTDTADDVYYASDVWSNPVKRQERWDELVEFLNSIPTASIEKQEGGMEYVDSVLLGHLETVIRQIPPKSTLLKSHVNPTKLYRAELFDGKVRPDPDADFQLLDRVVSTTRSTSVPFGLQGTVIALQSDKIEVLFDKEFPGGYKRGEMASCARLPLASLINITYGKKRKGAAKVAQFAGQQKSPMVNRLTAGKETAWSQKSTPQKNYKDQSSQRPQFLKRNSESDKASHPEKKTFDSQKQVQVEVVSTPKPQFQILKKLVVSDGKENAPSQGAGELDRKRAENELSAMLGLMSVTNDQPAHIVKEEATEKKSRKERRKEVYASEMLQNEAPNETPKTSSSLTALFSNTRPIEASFASVITTEKKSRKERRKEVFESKMQQSDTSNVPKMSSSVNALFGNTLLNASSAEATEVQTVDQQPPQLAMLFQTQADVNYQLAPQRKYSTMTSSSVKSVFESSENHSADKIAATKDEPTIHRRAEDSWMNQQHQKPYDKSQRGKTRGTFNNTRGAYNNYTSGPSNRGTFGKPPFHLQTSKTYHAAPHGYAPPPPFSPPTSLPPPVIVSPSQMLTPAQFFSIPPPFFTGRPTSSGKVDTNDPKLTDLMPSTVSKPFHKKKSRGSHSGAVSVRTQPTKQPVEQAGGSEDAGSVDDSANADGAAAAGGKKKPPRANRLALNFQK